MTPQLYTFSKNIRTFFGQHHAVIFATAIGLLLSLAIFSLYEVLVLPTSEPTTQSSVVDKFDQKTIDKIKTLHDSSNGTSSVTLPSPRPNPFVEP